MTALEAMGIAAKHAYRTLSIAGETTKNIALSKIAQALCSRSDEILEENKKDLAQAEENGMSASLLDRLRLDPKRIAGIAEGVEKVVALDDPIGKISEMKTRPNGLMIGKKTVPLGVVGIIYEARPNVTVDAAALCLKSGNAVILRGGKEAFYSNRILAAIMRDAIKAGGLPEDCICFVEDTSRESARGLMELTEYLDVLIPRGGAGLIRSVVENAKVPVIETGVGICHVYADDSADPDMAAEIVFNAKCSRPSVCNAIEGFLVSERIAPVLLPMVKEKLDKKNVELRGCEKTMTILGDAVKPATERDFRTEFGDYILAVKVVSGLDEAIAFINEYGSGHSESIVTGSYVNAQRFLNEVDAAAVYVNASTRFTDGFEFGLGAEIGISTQKMHARGPMGLEQLTSCKYIIYGSGQVR
jgi:glutamate-5-semialdehyde dehydrogenase